MSSWRPIPSELRTHQNLALLTYLDREQPHTHSDLVEELYAALSDAAVSYFCPAPEDYAFTIAYRPNGIIVGAAVGMRDVLVRVKAEMIHAAVADGALLAEDIGDHWTRFPVFSSTSPLETKRERLAKWLQATCRATPLLTATR